MTTATFDAKLVQDACEEASLEARKAAKAFFDKHGDRDACGFAWVDIFGVRGNTKLGRALKEAGVSKSHTGAFQIWNPSNMYVQNVDTLEAGAQAAADVFKKYGFSAYAGSRLD